MTDIATNLARHAAYKPSYSAALIPNTPLGADRLANTIRKWSNPKAIAPSAAPATRLQALSAQLQAFAARFAPVTNFAAPRVVSFGLTLMTAISLPVNLLIDGANTACDLASQFATNCWSGIKFVRATPKDAARYTFNAVFTRKNLNPFTYFHQFVNFEARHFAFTNHCADRLLGTLLNPFGLLSPLVLANNSQTPEEVFNQQELAGLIAKNRDDTNAFALLGKTFQTNLPGALRAIRFILNAIVSSADKATANSLTNQLDTFTTNAKPADDTHASTENAIRQETQKRSRELYLQIAQNPKLTSAEKAELANQLAQPKATLSNNTKVEQSWLNPLEQVLQAAIDTTNKSVNTGSPRWRLAQRGHAGKELSQLLALFAETPRDDKTVRDLLAKFHSYFNQCKPGLNLTDFAQLRPVAFITVYEQLKTEPALGKQALATLNLLLALHLQSLERPTADQIKTMCTFANLSANLAARTPNLLKALLSATSKLDAKGVAEVMPDLQETFKADKANELALLRPAVLQLQQKNLLSEVAPDALLALLDHLAILPATPGKAQPVADPLNQFLSSTHLSKEQRSALNARLEKHAAALNPAGWLDIKTLEGEAQKLNLLNEYLNGLKTAKANSDWLVIYITQCAEPLVFAQLAKIAKDKAVGPAELAAFDTLVSHLTDNLPAANLPILLNVLAKITDKITNKEKDALLQLLTHIANKLGSNSGLAHLNQTDYQKCINFLTGFEINLKKVQFKDPAVLASFARILEQLAQDHLERLPLPPLTDIMSNFQTTPSVKEPIRLLLEQVIKAQTNALFNKEGSTAEQTKLKDVHDLVTAASLTLRTDLKESQFEQSVSAQLWKAALAARDEKAAKGDVNQDFMNAFNKLMPQAPNDRLAFITAGLTALQSMPNFAAMALPNLAALLTAALSTAVAKEANSPGKAFRDQVEAIALSKGSIAQALNSMPSMK